MAHFNSSAASLFVAFILALGHSGLSAQESLDDAGTLERRTLGLSESTPRASDHRTELHETRLIGTDSDTDIGALSSDSASFFGVFAEHSAVAELHRFETLRPADGIWRISHTRNPNGEFSLVRSSDAVQVSIGGAPSHAIAGYETLELACSKTAQAIRIESDSGKNIYSGEMRCGDAIFVDRGVAQ